MRTCFVHIGTHKTGTTSLQLAMSGLAPDLLERGLLYPTTGRPPEGPAGHHNLAWEITGDRRFKREYGTLDDLLREVEHHRGQVVISSEDFESAVAHLDGLTRFVQQLQSHDFRVTFVVYLRNQRDYLTSLYATLLNFGLATPFRSFAEAALRDRRFIWQEWTFAFDYDDLVAALERLEVTEVIVRSYDQASRSGLFDDFFGVLGIDPGTLKLDSRLRAYQRPLAADLLKAFCANQKGVPLNAAEDAVVDLLCGSIPGSALDPSPRLCAAVEAAFQDANSRVLSRHGLPAFDAAGPSGGATPGLADPPSLETVFSDACAERVLALGAATRADLERLETERDELAARVGALEGEVGRLTAHAAQLAAAGEAMRREREALTTSTTWKATAPLRWLRGRIR